MADGYGDHLFSAKWQASGTNNDDDDDDGDDDCMGIPIQNCMYN